MFDITETLSGRWSGRAGVRILDGFTFHIAEEHQRNSLMPSIEQKLVAKTLEQGFTIEVLRGAGGSSNSDADVKREKITDPQKNPFLSQLWNEAAAEAMRHRLRYGFCVIQRRLIRDPFKAENLQQQAAAVSSRHRLNTREAASAHAAVNDTAENVEIDGELDIAQFFADERAALQKHKPKSAPSLQDPAVLGYQVPHVLNPLTECYVKFFRSPDGSRIYKAFPRNDETQDSQPIPNTRVHIFFPPNDFGVPNSPFLFCLEDLQTVRNMLSRYEQRDYWNTHPPHFYRSVPKAGGEAVIPNSTSINYSETGTEKAAEIQRNWAGPVQVEPQSVDKRIAQLELSNNYMKHALNDSVSKAVPPGTQLSRPLYNNQLEKLTYIQPIDQFGPRQIIPEQMELASNVPHPTHAPDFMAVYSNYIQRICAVCGIMSESLLGDRSTVAADAEMRRIDGDSAIRTVQRELERMLAQIYVDIFTPVHRAQIVAEIAEKRYQARLAELDSSEALHHEGLELKREVDELKAAMSRMPEGEERVALHDVRRKKKDRLGELPELDFNADRMPWDDQNEQIRIEDEIEQGQVDEYLRIRMESEMRVEVHVRENPSLTYEDAKKLFDAKVITLATFGKIALRLLGLPEEYQATEAELTADAKTQAKREELFQPKEPAGGGPSSAAEKRPSSGSDSAAKKENKSSA